MRELSQKIYDALMPTLQSGQYVPMRKLESALQLTERGLQSSAGKPGDLDIAIDEIFREKGKVIVTLAGKYGGVKLTENIEEIEHAYKALSAHTWHSLDRVKRWEKIIDQMRVETDPGPQIQIQF